MTLLRDGDDVDQLVATAAAGLRLPDGLVEKDHWLTQLLRRLAADHLWPVPRQGRYQPFEGLRADQAVL